MRFEQSGIPAILICTERFAGMAKMIASSHGVPDLRIISVQHPLGGLLPEALEVRLREGVELLDRLWSEESLAR